MTGVRVWKRSALGPIVLVVAMTSGCRWVPVRPTAPASGNPPVSSTSETAAELPIPELPPAPALKPVSDEEALAASGKTEILDAVASRDDAVKQAIAETPPPPPIVTEPTPNVQKTETNVKPVLETEKPALRPAEAHVEPSRTWKTEVDRLLELARANAKNETGSAELWATRERVLNCLSDPDEAILWNTVMNGLSSPAPVAEPAAEPPKELIADLRLCRKVIGFGKTEPLATETLKPGQDVLLYCEVEGQEFEPSADGFRARLVSSISLLPASGADPVWHRDFEVKDWCRRKRRDFFVGYNFSLPPDLAPGTYLVRLVQRDQIGNTSATKVLPIIVQTDSRANLSTKP